MAAKKDKSGSFEALRADVQTLADAFWSFKDAMLTDAAVRQAEQQTLAPAPAESTSWREPDNTTVESTAAMLAALGHPQRLRIALLLANEPLSVNDIVQQLGLNTSGSAYHHLNVLVNAGIATQPQRGSFEMAEQAMAPVTAVLTSFFGEDESESESEKEEKPSGKKKKK